MQRTGQPAASAAQRDGGAGDSLHRFNMVVPCVLQHVVPRCNTWRRQHAATAKAASHAQQSKRMQNGDARRCLPAAPAPLRPPPLPFLPPRARARAPRTPARAHTWLCTSEQLVGGPRLSGPLMRVRLFKRDVPGDALLLIVVHSIVLDSWGLIELLDDLRMLCVPLRLGRGKARPTHGPSLCEPYSPSDSRRARHRSARHVARVRASSDAHSSRTTAFCGVGGAGTYRGTASCRRRCKSSSQTSATASPSSRDTTVRPAALPLLRHGISSCISGRCGALDAAQRVAWCCNLADCIATCCTRVATWQTSGATRSSASCRRCSSRQTARGAAP